MACINCEDCKEYDRPVPSCSVTTVQIGTIPASPSSNFRVLMTKGNGTNWETEITTDVGGNVVIDIGNADVGRDWFSPDAGFFKLQILDRTFRTVQTFQDANAVQTECALMEFTALNSDWAGAMRINFKA